MGEKVNVAELLKDCPKGMELDCTMWDNVKFSHIDMTRDYPIYITIEGNAEEQLTKYGQWSHNPNSKCVIFPKGKTTWEGFQRPFKDGDILATDLGSVFYLNTRLNTDERYGCYVGTGGDSSFHICIPFAYKECCGFATEEEKQKLFKAIKDNGYKWNDETKTLEKLIEPKFKVGDKIKNKNSGICDKVIKIFEDCYLVESFLDEQSTIDFDIQDNWELVASKFDINTLKPFESRVLVRDSIKGIWYPELFGCLCDSNDCPYMVLGGNRWKYCIPFEDNEHLLKTNNDCDEYYKTWE